MTGEKEGGKKTRQEEHLYAAEPLSFSCPSRFTRCLSFSVYLN